MVTLEVGIDAAGLVRGSRDAMSALNALNNSVQHLTHGLDAIGAVGGGFGKFAGLLSKAQPWLMAVTTALAAVSAGMAMFGRASDSTTDAVKKQVHAVDELIRKADELSIRKGYGAGDPRLTVGGSIDALTALRMSPDKKQYSIGEAAALFGLSETKMREALGEGALETRLPKQRNDDVMMRWNRSTFTSQELQGAGERLLGKRRADPGGTFGAMSPGDAMRGRGFGEDMSGGGWPEGTGESQNLLAGRSWGSFDTTKQTEQAKREDQQRTIEAMREIEYRSQRIGDYMGDAATRFLLGISSARDLLREVATDLLRMGLSNGFANIAKGFMATPTQAAG